MMSIKQILSLLVTLHACSAQIKQKDNCAITPDVLLATNNTCIDLTLCQNAGALCSLLYSPTCGKILKEIDWCMQIS